METIIISENEHKILKEHKRKLEYHFGVKINLPVASMSNCSNDKIVASVYGETKYRNFVKKFLQMKMDKLSQRQAQSSATESNIPVITLSESDSDNTVLIETQNKSKKWRRKRKVKLGNKEVKYPQPIIGLAAASKQNYKELCQVFGNLSDPKVQEGSLPSTVTCQTAVNVPNKITTEDMDDSVVILCDKINLQTTDPLIGIAQNLPAKSNFEGGNDIPVTDDSIIVLSEDIHMPSTSNHKKDITKEIITKSSDDNVIVVSEDESFPPTPEFLSLRTSRYAIRKGDLKRKKALITLSDTIPQPGPRPVSLPLRTSRNAIKKDDLKQKEAIFTLPDTIPQPIAKARKVLRPIVIDGSNVAREHGKVKNVFSCKGIKISIEYFLKRGHTQVTALLPHFRKYCRNSSIPTTDEDILEELEKTQNVVYTPSRRVNGRMMSCYDDRFIVDLASKIEGVILSNDNYRDIMDESPQFKKTIEERLLMFCFVGDILMIPEDPLGRYGPKLDAFLSMKESNDETQSSFSHDIQMSLDKAYGANGIPR